MNRVSNIVLSLAFAILLAGCGESDSRECEQRKCKERSGELTLPVLM